MELTGEDVLRLGIAIVLGGLIGAEREYRDKAAGFRTMTLISVGAALFTIFSSKLGGPDDPARITANIVTGVGFLGAGAIMREGGRVTGITTAATIWLVAALGVGVGGGYYLFSCVAALASLVVLVLFPLVESRIDRLRDTRSYQVVYTRTADALTRLEGEFEGSGLHVRSHRQQKRGEELICSWEAVGPPRCHKKLVETLLKDPAVKDFHF